MLWEIFNAKTLNELKDLIIFFEISFKDIVLEESKFLETIRENHEPNAVLYALKPKSAVDVPIDPIHLSVTLSQVISVLTFVDIAALPIEFTVVVFLVSPVLTLKLVANPFYWCGSSAWVRISFLAPLAFTMLHAIEELTCIGVPILPLVLTEPIWVAVAILPDVLIAI